MTELATLTVEQGQDWILVRVSGEIDMSNTDSLARMIREPADPARAQAHRQESGVTPPRLVVLDLSDVAYLDSAGVALIDTLSGELHHTGRTLRVVAPVTGIARRTLVITCLDTALEVAETRDDALAAARTP